MTAADFLRRLSPISQTSGQDTIWGIWLYLFGILVLIALGRQKLPSQGTLYLLSASLLFMLIDKVAVGTGVVRIGGAELFARGGDGALGTFFMRAAMFIFPLLGVAISKNPKSRVWGVLAFVIGGAYFLVRGIVDMRFFSGPYS